MDRQDHENRLQTFRQTLHAATEQPAVPCRGLCARMYHRRQVGAGSGTSSTSSDAAWNMCCHEFFFWFLLRTFNVIVYPLAAMRQDLQKNMWMKYDEIRWGSCSSLIRWWWTPLPRSHFWSSSFVAMMRIAAGMVLKPILTMELPWRICDRVMFWCLGMSWRFFRPYHSTSETYLVGVSKLCTWSKMAWWCLDFDPNWPKFGLASCSYEKSWKITACSELLTSLKKLQILKQHWNNYVRNPATVALSYSTALQKPNIDIYSYGKSSSSWSLGNHAFSHKSVSWTCIKPQDNRIQKERQPQTAFQRKLMLKPWGQHPKEILLARLDPERPRAPCHVALRVLQLRRRESWIQLFGHMAVDGWLFWCMFMHFVYFLYHFLSFVHKRDFDAHDFLNMFWYYLRFYVLSRFLVRDFCRITRFLI